MLRQLFYNKDSINIVEHCPTKRTLNIQGRHYFLPFTNNRP